MARAFTDGPDPTPSFTTQPQAQPVNQQPTDVPDPNRKLRPPLPTGPQSVGALTGDKAPSVDPLAFAPPQAATNAQGLTTPGAAPAQSGASWLGAPAIDYSVPDAGGFGAPPVQNFGLPPGPAMGGQDPTMSGPPVQNFGLPTQNIGPSQGPTTGGPPVQNFGLPTQNIGPSAGPQSVASLANPASGDAKPYTVGSGLNTANPNATPGNPFAGMKSDEGGQFGPDAGHRLDAQSIRAVLGGQPGQYDALSNRLAASPELYKQWQGILGNDPQSVAAALKSGDPDLTKIAQTYASRNARDSTFAFGPQGQVWGDLAAGNYGAHKQTAEELTNRALGATFVPGQGSARVDSSTGQIILGDKVLGNINDPNLDFDKLRAATGAPGGFSMNANGQLVPTTPPQPQGKSPFLSQPDLPVQGAPGGPPVQNFGLPTQNIGPSQGPTTGGQGAPQTLSGMLGQGGPAGLSTAAPGLQPTQTPTDANNPLTAQTLSPGPTADRFKLAQDQWANFDKATAPQYQASLRDAIRLSAAAGGEGSGQLRTSLGDLANQRALALDTQRTGLLNQALGGSIDDAYRNVGIAQQQQGFQQSQQQQAFGNEMSRLGLSDQLKNSSFGRALEQLMMGGQGNPADTQLALSSIFGQQAGQAGQSLSNLVRSRAAASGGQPDYSSLLQNVLSGFQPRAPQRQAIPPVQSGPAPTYRPSPYRGTVTSPGPTRVPRGY